MQTLFEIIRLATFLSGIALIGRMGRDRLKYTSHFIQKSSRMRWWMMLAFSGTLTLSALIAFIVNPTVTVATYTQLLSLAAISFAHRFLDCLVPEDDADNAARVEAATKWVNAQLKGD